MAMILAVSCLAGLVSSVLGAVPSTLLDGCGEGLFTCQDGKCVPEKWVCDGNADCDDISDESYTACHAISCNEDLQFRCDNGRCIGDIWRCDGQNDCVDGSDEKNCRDISPCLSGDSVCDGGSVCVTEEMRCNGIMECTDGSDELRCMDDFCDTAVYTFRCDDKCIPDSWVCDNKTDCTDGSDEKQCSVCDPGLLWDTEEKKCITPDFCTSAKCQQGCERGKCTCISGYYLDIDERSCLLEDSTLVQILTLNQHKLTDRTGLGVGVFAGVTDVEGLVDLDFNYPFQKIAYVDSRERAIMSTDMKIEQTVNKRSVTKRVIYRYGSTVAGNIVVDWISDNIYWTNVTYSGIMVSNQEGSKVAELLKVQTRPHNLQIDSVRGKLYWIGTEGVKSNIYTCYRDNTEYRVLFKDQFHPAHLTLDTTTGNIYWYDSIFSSIFSSNLEKEEEGIFSTVYRNTAGNIQSLSYFNGVLYWIKQENDTLSLVKYYVNNEQIIEKRAVSNEATKLILYHPTMQDNSEYNDLGSCRNNRGGCSDLCFVYPGTRSCGCLHQTSDTLDRPETVNKADAGSDDKTTSPDDGFSSYGTGNQAGILSHCTPDLPACSPVFCYKDNLCDIVQDREMCTCLVGYYGTRCQWIKCKDNCTDNTTSCFFSMIRDSKYCCKPGFQDCEPVPTEHIQSKSHHINFSIIIVAATTTVIIVCLMAAAFGYRKWNRIKRPRSATLVDIYPMEPVIDELKHEDDEPLLYD